jgi:CrcB protein
MTLLLIAAGAAVGAPARYLTDRWVTSRKDGDMPWGTFVVNVLGSLILGMVASGVAAQHVGASVALVLGTGFCGALTTFSTFGYETVRLIEVGMWRAALTNVLLNVCAGLLAASAGWGLATLLW